jgi:hypothetical protein
VICFGSDEIQPKTEDTTGGSMAGDDSLPAKNSATGAKELPEELRQEVLPSPEIGQEQLGNTGGVGPLSGENDVSTLPEKHALPGQLLLLSMRKLLIAVDEASDKPKNIASGMGLIRLFFCETNFPYL